MADFTQTITITETGGIYFRITRRDYENGTYEERSERIGNAAQSQRQYADTLRAQAESLAGSIEQVSKFKGIIGDMKGTDNDLETATTFRPSALIVQEFKEAEFPAPATESTGWTIRETSGGAFVPVVFSVNNQGLLRYNVNGTGAKTADFFGAVMRLRNYPAAPNDMDMYRLSNGNYTNSDRSVVIRRPGSNLNSISGD